MLRCAARPRLWLCVRVDRQRRQLCLCGHTRRCCGSDGSCFIQHRFIIKGSDYVYTFLSRQRNQCYCSAWVQRGRSFHRLTCFLRFFVFYFSFCCCCCFRSCKDGTSSFSLSVAVRIVSSYRPLISLHLEWFNLKLA